MMYEKQKSITNYVCICVYKYQCVVLPSHIEQCLLTRLQSPYHLYKFLNKRSLSKYRKIKWTLIFLFLKVYRLRSTYPTVWKFSFFLLYYYGNLPSIFLSNYFKFSHVLSQSSVAKKCDYQVGVCRSRSPSARRQWVLSRHNHNTYRLGISTRLRPLLIFFHTSFWLWRR